jgi:hypothetical protein
LEEDEGGVWRMESSSSSFTIGSDLKAFFFAGLLVGFEVELCEGDRLSVGKSGVDAEVGNSLSEKI